MLDRVFFCCWTQPTGCESSQAAPMTPIQLSESRACVVVSPSIRCASKKLPNQHWFGWPIIGKPFEGFHVQNFLYTQMYEAWGQGICRADSWKPLWPHLAPLPHITMEPASNCPTAADPRNRATKNAMHSATAAAPSGGSCQGRSSANGDVGAPQCWLRVRVHHHTKFHNELWGFYSMQGIPLIHSIGLWVLPVDL